MFMLRDRLLARLAEMGNSPDHQRLAHFAERRWRALKPAMSRIADAEWQPVGSELEALIHEGDLIHRLQPMVNVQTSEPAVATRDIPRALMNDVLVIVPSIELDSVELVGACVDGASRRERHTPGSARRARRA